VGGRAAACATCSTRQAALPASVVDEIDAVGRQPGRPILRRLADEREADLNQILVEMVASTRRRTSIVVAAPTGPMSWPGAPAPRAVRPPGDPRPAGHEGRWRSCAALEGQAARQGLLRGRSRAAVAGLLGARISNLVNEERPSWPRPQQEADACRSFQEALERCRGPRAARPGDLGRRAADHRVHEGGPRRVQRHPPEVRPGGQGTINQRGNGLVHMALVRRTATCRARTELRARSPGCWAGNA